MKQVDTAVNTAVDFDYFSMEDNRESLVEWEDERRKN
jgi:hypothetical protein